MKNFFNIAHIKLYTKTEGPFARCCIWFQGCNIRCKGCCNNDLQPLFPNKIISQKKLIEIVKKAKEKYKIEGITLSGGEPSLQKGLINFNKKIHKLGLGIIMFSGKYRNEIDKNLVDSVDLLIDGPFILEELDDKRILLGSKNKKIHCITERYKNYLDYFNNPISIQEVTVEEYIFINGD